ncbi:hypothetical protein J3P85_07365 [Pseudomonas sp. Z1-12]|jgi:hypothetical protein|uniref:hypothetical protein n=1 Tax=Pseudomonas sp. Z1-12 TaxID=2817408 RepID=UPI003DAA399E
MEDHKAHTIPPAVVMKMIRSHSVQVMTEYYSKGKIGGCFNSARALEDPNKESANCLFSKDRS